MHKDSIYSISSMKRKPLSNNREKQIMDSDDISNDFVLVKHHHNSYLKNGDGCNGNSIRVLPKQSKTPDSVNLFNNSDTDCNDEYLFDKTTELTQLRPRGSVTVSNSYSSTHAKLAADNIVFLRREILPNDTLQSFALQYNCTVNDLKRANNLIKEQEFFALRQIKIPVKKYGLLTEYEEELKRRPISIAKSKLQSECTAFGKSDEESNYSDSQCDKDEIDFNKSQKLLFNQANSPRRNSAIENNDANRFLKTVDKDILSTVKKTENNIVKNEVLEEVVSSLGSVKFQPLPLPGTKPPSECDGSTWGLTWQMVIVSFVVGLVFIVGFIIIKDFVGL